MPFLRQPTRVFRTISILEDERLTKTKITAPFDCTVLSRPVSVGQAVSGSAGVGGGTEVLAIADLNEMIIQAHINQADVTRLKVNQKVSVQVEAVPGLVVSGQIASGDLPASMTTLQGESIRC